MLHGSFSLSHVLSCRLLGYNAVRLPFRYRDLDQFGPKDFVSLP